MNKLEKTIEDAKVEAAKRKVEAAKRKADLSLHKRREKAMKALGAEDPDGLLVFGTTIAARLLGISPKALKSILEPVEYAKNPHYKTGPMVALYDPIDLLRISKQSRVKKALARCTPKRKAGAQRAVDTKRKNLMEWLDALVIVFDLPSDMTKSHLAELAIEHRNAVSAYYPSGDPRPGFESASYKTGCENEEHVHRWIVNYLRHCATDYDCLLAEKAGKTGFSDMYSVLKYRIGVTAEEYIQSLS